MSRALWTVAGYLHRETARMIINVYILCNAHCFIYVHEQYNVAFSIYIPVAYNICLYTCKHVYVHCAHFCIFSLA